MKASRVVQALFCAGVLFDRVGAGRAQPDRVAGAGAHGDGVCHRRRRSRRGRELATTRIRPKCGRCRGSARCSIPTSSASSRCGPDLVLLYGSQTDLMAQLTRASIPVFRVSARRAGQRHRHHSRARPAARPRRSRQNALAREHRAAARRLSARTARPAKPRTLLVSDASAGRCATSTRAAGEASCTRCSRRLEASTSSPTSRPSRSRRRGADPGARAGGDLELRPTEIPEADQRPRRCGPGEPSPAFRPCATIACTFFPAAGTSCPGHASRTAPKRWRSCSRDQPNARADS